MEDRATRLTPTDVYVKKHFVPYEIAKALQEIGFDEASVAWTTETYKDIILGYRAKKAAEIKVPTLPIVVPTYQETIEWFFEKHNLHLLFDIQADYDDNISADVTHDKIQTTVTGYVWTMYPNFFTENDGYTWFDVEKSLSFYEARANAILKAIEIVKSYAK